ncbi:MAG TPA: hypothetical protein VEQ63_07315, partial [Bryobacteraceae bacterium]|nr:hypothetical protein [Bryobacteraceae bacterium]
MVSLVGTYFAARRSLVAGLSAMLAAGYIYGITRANLLSPATHFLFDAALIGLYSVQLFQPA